MHAAGLHRVVRDVVDVEAFLAQEAAEPVAVPVLRGLLKHVPAPPPGFDQLVGRLSPHALHRLDQLWRRGVHPHAFGGKIKLYLRTGQASSSATAKSEEEGRLARGCVWNTTVPLGWVTEQLVTPGSNFPCASRHLPLPARARSCTNPSSFKKKVPPILWVVAAPSEAEECLGFGVSWHFLFLTWAHEKNGMILKNFLIANIFFTGRPYLECRVPCRDCTLDCHRLCFCNNRDR